MPLNPLHFIVTVLLALIAIVFIAVLWALRYDYRNRQAIEYLNGRRAGYCNHDTGWREITPQVAQAVFGELYNIPWSSAALDEFWHDEYVNLLEFFLAICEDREAQANLIYGTLIERRRKCRYPQKRLIWVEYTYDGRDWILWVDSDRANPDDGSLLRNDGYKMFREFGEVYCHATYGRHEVCRIFDKHHPTN